MTSAKSVVQLAATRWKTRRPTGGMESLPAGWLMRGTMTGLAALRVAPAVLISKGAGRHHTYQFHSNCHCERSVAISWGNGVTSGNEIATSLRSSR